VNHDIRSTPEDFLELARKEERTGQGNLRIYLGMCPGVGKTYSMLEDARRLQAEGSPVLVGVAETHGRKETDALLTGLKILSRRTIRYRETNLLEFDLDAALRLKPPLILVDELAHSNAPGCRHPKRWQDVQELLESGIDVWTTINIQHVESLRDAIASITGIRIQETVPDTFLEEAAEIRVVDITPEQLKDRLEAGKVYLGDRAVTAADNFFREGNLRALREMALRFTTFKVDAEKREFMRRNLIPGPWRTGERFLVAVGPSPHSERLIRIACRLAQAHDTTWVAAYVDAGRSLDVADAKQLADNLSLARSLGGEVVSLSREDTVDGILQIARRENITQIIAGKAIDSTWWSRVQGNLIADRLQRESGAIDILLVHPSEGPTRDIGPRRIKTSMPRPGIRDIMVALLSLCGITLLGLLMEGLIGYQAIALLFILGVALAGMTISRWTAICMALGSGLAWNFFFTEPRLTFAMMKSDDVVLMITVLGVAIVIGHLTTRLRQREEMSRKGEERARALYQLTRVTSASTTLEQAAKAALAQVKGIFQAEAALLNRDDSGTLETIAGDRLNETEVSVCQWALDNDQPAGRFTNTLPQSTVLALPLMVNGNCAAIFAIRPHNEQLESPLQRDLLETFGIHFSVMMEKDEFQRSQRESAVLEQSRLFQRTLLDHVSHEIKTPVAVIQGATEHLLQSEHQKETETTLQEISQAAKRLNRVFTQLVTLSRAEAGLIQPTLEICDARDLMNEVAEMTDRNRIDIEGGQFTLRTDHQILQTVLMNLIQNGLQHSNEHITLSSRQENQHVIFDVVNKGTPISEQDRDLIFERFQRGSKALAGGMGLGLPIARQFAALLGGTVRLVSSNDEKTIFSLSLPEGF